MKQKPLTHCAHCYQPEKVYTRGRHTGLIRWHFHLWIPGLTGCPGSRKAPAGGAR